MLDYKVRIVLNRSVMTGWRNTILHRKRVNTCGLSFQTSHRNDMAQSQREWEKDSTIDLSRFFPMVGGHRRDGGNEADDESLRKMKTNKQRQS